MITLAWVSQFSGGGEVGRKREGGSKSLEKRTAENRQGLPGQKPKEKGGGRMPLSRGASSICGGGGKR